MRRVHNIGGYKYENSRLLIILIIIVVLLFSFNPVFANSILKKIDVLINNIELYVNKEQVLVDNFLYNGL